MPIIKINNLSFSYDKDIILEDINLDVEQKDFLAIIGPNGGGKSTLIKLILGINKLNDTKNSQITIFGKNISQGLDKIGYVPQNTNVNIDFPIKVIEVVMMGRTSKRRSLFGYTSQELQSAMIALEQVGMEEFSDVKIGSLSGGQRQRVMIARALYNNPKVLILDEPTSSIDVEGQKQIYDLLKVLNENITIIVVSHDISVILSYANKVAHINKNISYHDMNISKDKILNNDDEHFCEVELLHMLNHHHEKIPKKDCTC
jgi:zinc transport system ATP-binding protein